MSLNEQPQPDSVYVLLNVLATSLH